MNSTIVDHLFESAVSHIEDPIYTIDLDKCIRDGMSENELNDLKKKFTENGYVFSDGRKNGWQRLWIRKQRV